MALAVDHHHTHTRNFLSTAIRPRLCTDRIFNYFLHSWRQWNLDYWPMRNRLHGTRQVRILNFMLIFNIVPINNTWAKVSFLPCPCGFLQAFGIRNTKDFCFSELHCLNYDTLYVVPMLCLGLLT